MHTNYLQNNAGSFYHPVIRIQATVDVQESGESSIRRNVRPVATSGHVSDIFNSARQIYFRARRTHYSRALSIL